MKRIRIALILLVIAIAIGFFLWRNLNHTAAYGTMDFALKNPTKITRIFMSSNEDKKGYIILEKNAKNQWWVSSEKKKYRADTAFVNDLLNYVMPHLQVKNPVSDGAKATITREMAIKAVKAEFYEGKTLVRTLYCGGPNNNSDATYMYLPAEGNEKKHERPCEVILPGHGGYVTPYFTTQINNWRSPALIDIPSGEIASVSLTWTEHPEQSFTVLNSLTGVELKDSRGKTVTANRNTLLAYLDMFTWITRETGEGPGINQNKESKTALLSSTPFLVLDVAKTDGKHEVLQLYQRPVSEETYSPETRTGKLKVYETDTYWGVMRGSDEIWVLQDAILKNRIRRLQDFTTK